MDGSWILPALTFGTMFAFLGYATWNKKKVEEQIARDDRRSSLAADGDRYKAKL